MHQDLTAVLLAGTLRPTPLRQALDLPRLCLPVDHRGSLLDAWLRCLEGIGCHGDVRIVMNSETDAEAVGVRLRQEKARSEEQSRIRAIAEPASWRGVAGILRDVTGQIAEGSIVVVGEAGALPPDDPAPILEMLDATAAAGVVGIYGEDEPAGVYAFRREVFGRVPPIGYHDLKEQLLPQLAEAGIEIRAARLRGSRTSLRDRRDYLDAVRARLASTERDGGSLLVATNAGIAPTAVLDGACIVEDGVVVEDTAVVHDSVLLRGARIGRGAVVSLSVVGPGTAVAADSRVVRAVVFDASATAAPDTVDDATPVRESGPAPVVGGEHG
jgi:hypothetical protein